MATSRMRRVLWVVAAGALVVGCNAESASSGPPSTTTATTTTATSPPVVAPVNPPGFIDVKRGEGDSFVAVTDRFALALDARLTFHDRSVIEPFLRSGSDGAPSGLYVVRGGVRRHVSSIVRDRDVILDRDRLQVRVGFDDSTVGTLTATAPAADTMKVLLKPDDPTGVTAWGAVMATTEDEAIYGLQERIVDDYPSSEILPQEVGSLNRKGEKVTMYVRPTMSGYAPFYQSSKGYGILVDGTMPGTYDLGATDKTKVEFEFELDPQMQEGSFHVFYGPGHPAILDAYTRLTGRAPVPPDAVFTTWRGRDEYRKGATARWHDLEINADVARDLNAYDQHKIPPGVFHFDRPWAAGQEGYGELRFDPERFPNAEAMLAEMQKAGWRMEVWTSPWAIGVNGEEAKAKGYLAPNSPRAIDLTNAAARDWLKGKLLTFLRGPEGTYVDGFFMDRADEPDVSSTAADIYADGRNGRQIHNAYPVLFQQLMREVIDEARPNNAGWLIARPGYTGSQKYVMRWGGDTASREGLTIPEVPSTTPSTDKGLRSVLISMQRAAFMGTAFWGSDIAGYSQWNDRDLYARWIEVGALSPLMRFHGQGPAPWDLDPSGAVDAELLKIYQRYVALHASLQPYLGRLAREANATGLTPVRPLVFTWPDQAAAKDRWDQWTLGPDLLAAPVWKKDQRSRTVWFPPGRWIDYWDRGQIVEGPVEREVSAPLDRVPLYVKQGSELERLAVPAG